MLARILVLTVLTTLFCLAVGLFFGIVGVSIANAVRGGGISLAHAYLHVAFPFAAVGLVCALLGMIVWEGRRYRRESGEWLVTSGERERRST